MRVSFIITLLLDTLILFDRFGRNSGCQFGAVRHLRVRGRCTDRPPRFA